MALNRTSQTETCTNIEDGSRIPLIRMKAENGDRMAAWQAPKRREGRHVLQRDQRTIVIHGVVQHYGRGVRARRYKPDPHHSSRWPTRARRVARSTMLGDSGTQERQRRQRQKRTGSILRQPLRRLYPPGDPAEEEPGTVAPYIQQPAAYRSRAPG